MATMKKFPARLKAYRLNKGLTQTELAQKAGVNQGTYSRWEKGELEPSPGNILRLAQCLDVSVEQLLAPDDSTPGIKVRVIGELAAGSFKEAVEWDYGDQFDMPVILPKELSGLPLQGFVVKGPSMNKVYPEGSVVFAAPVHALPGHPRTDDYVVVMRRDKYGMIEATLKQYEVDADGKQWLWPRSNDPMHQAPVDYLGPKDGDVEQVHITGVVMAALTYAKR